MSSAVDKEPPFQSTSRERQSQKEIFSLRKRTGSQAYPKRLIIMPSPLCINNN